MVLSGFAKLVGINFDIEQVDISNLTRRTAKNNLEWQVNRISNDVLDILKKQDYYTHLLRHLRCEVFFQG